MGGGEEGKWVVGCRGDVKGWGTDGEKLKRNGNTVLSKSETSTVKELQCAIAHI